MVSFDRGCWVFSHGILKTNDMLYVGADHNGRALKEAIKRTLEKQSLAFRDLDMDRLTIADDYPLIAARVARAVQRSRKHSGILLCGSGNGMVMAANRFPKIRAALAPAARYAVKARTDEDANILVLPAWWLTTAQASRIVLSWLTAKAKPVKRHRRRQRQLLRLPRG